MSNDNFSFDLEDILAEFSGKAPAQDMPREAAAELKEIKEEAPPAAPIVESKATVVEETIIVPAIKDVKPAAKAEPKRRPGSSLEEFEALFSREKLKKEVADKRAAMAKSSRGPAMTNVPERKASAAQKPKAAPAAAKPIVEPKPAPLSKKEARPSSRRKRLSRRPKRSPSPLPPLLSHTLRSRWRRRKSSPRCTAF